MITHPDMLACNQNGVCGFNTLDEDGTEIWITPDKGHSGKGWMGVFNRTNQAKRVFLTRENTGMMHFLTGYKLVPFEGTIKMDSIWEGHSQTWDQKYYAGRCSSR